jgi:hypothetical protein
MSSGEGEDRVEQALKCADSHEVDINRRSDEGIAHRPLLALKVLAAEVRPLRSRLKEAVKLLKEAREWIDDDGLPELCAKMDTAIKASGEGA